MRMRDYLGLLVAVVADGVQVGSTVITLGADQLAVPVQLLFTAAVSAVLAALMGPHVRLLSGAVFELIPGLNVVPGFTGSALWVAMHNRRRLGEKKP